MKYIRHYYASPNIPFTCLHIPKGISNTIFILKQEAMFMPKDSQLDPKKVRKQKAKGGHTMAESAPDGEGRNTKKQSASRHKPGSDRS